MKKIFYTFLLISPLLFISSCDKIEHGCLDSYATNYNENANIDNNSCCYNCYDSNSNNLIGEFCGNDVGDIIANGFVSDEVVHLWSLNGESVPPNTMGAVPSFDWNGNPLYGTIIYENISCD